MKITRLNPAERRRILRMGLSHMFMHHRRLCDPTGLFEPWEYPSAIAFFFCMGAVQAFAGLTGLYSVEPIHHLTYWRAMLDGWLRRVLGIRLDPDLSRRIVDPRHRTAALEAIEDSRRQFGNRSASRSTSWERLFGGKRRR